MSYVYIKSQPGLWTVGHYGPGDEWHAESDHASDESAAKRVAWLNGSHGDIEPRFVVLCVPPRPEDHDDPGCWFMFDRTTGESKEFPTRREASNACRLANDGGV